MCVSRLSELKGQPASRPATVTAPIELQAGLAISGAPSHRRDAIGTDPVAAQMIAGRWTMPKAGDAVDFSGGHKENWEPVNAAADGWFSHPALRGGYLASTFSSPKTTVMILEACGHSLVYANREPRAGDIYETGYVQLPVQVLEGQNAILFQAGRGRLKARLIAPKAPAYLNTADVTTPDLLSGQPTSTEVAVVVVNATASSRDDLTIVTHLPGGPETRTAVPTLVPLSVRKVAVTIQGPAPPAAESCPLELKLECKNMGGSDHWETLDTATLQLRIRRPGQSRKQTFHSGIDGSLQYYAHVPALPGQAKTSPARPGLVLTLHGAAVEAIGQADAYQPKPGLEIIAPTNRRPYGFDWEDWGRLDAIEVLEFAQKSLDTDPRRTYLTGHSMGGHGTWHLGVTFPDRFAAIAPSAGWISMWSYAGATRGESPRSIEELLFRAMSPSDTLALARNLARLGVYSLHGDADDNVPVAQARRMRQVLGEFHPDFAYHEQPGAGHWWGSACVDWPPLFAFLEEHRLPTPDEVHRIDFVTASPAVSHRAFWATIEAQQKSMLNSAVHIELDKKNGRLRGTTENVTRLALDLGTALSAAGAASSLSIELDGQRLSSLSVDAAPDRRLWLTRSKTTWSAGHTPAPMDQKGPHRQGPFKQAFGNRFVLVYGTAGTTEEAAWILARARLDAETFWYRGNGSVDVVSDNSFLNPSRANEFKDRNVILYGHSQNNSAWAPLLGKGSVQVRPGEVQIGTRTVSGDDLGCLFIQPRPGSDRALVGVVSGTGLTGLRLTERLPYFTSGVAYPDCLLVEFKTWSEGNTTPKAAGYFGPDWGVETGEFAWRD
jgi:pimeloyl-ACP methyl ester carboxylesterase